MWKDFHHPLSLQKHRKQYEGASLDNGFLDEEISMEGDHSGVSEMFEPDDDQADDTPADCVGKNARMMICARSIA